ncbi:MAG: substrate-binding domain-containing protein [Spirochaetaceae bacterium]|jgi:ribose transport system substrate-binding protein|nr:substrate-binding domain-containing protein [Spirochaetaceae bacterium]
MKKRVLFAAVCFVLLLAMPVFGQVRSTLRQGETVKAMFIAMDSMDLHWLKLTRGAQQQAAKLKIDFTNNAPAGKVDAAQQIAIMEDAITAKYDIILLAPLNANALVPVVNKAKAAGIKVVLVDSHIGAGGNFDAFIGTDNAAAARTAADTLAKAIGGRGKVAIVNAQAGAGTTMIRENAFKEQIASKYPGITIVGTQYSDGDKAKALNIATDFMRANPDLAAIYACNEGSTVGVGNAVKQAGKAGKVVVVGWDKSPESQALVLDGTILAVMVQNPAAMGTMGIQAGVDLIQGKTVRKEADSGCTVGTKANIARL